jgi:DNA-binding SARP family transcriptional activator/tetratricopeptide (TPR) repeat protein
MAAVRVEFGLLGPLVVLCEGAVVPVASGRQGALLAALLLDADHVVTIGQLTEVLWGATPPASARAALHNQVRRLRDALTVVGRDRIRTKPGGYLIHLEQGELDVTRMRDLLAAARASGSDGGWANASALAASAVLLWRGEPMADVDSEVLAARIPDLTETYQQAVETRLDAEMHLGHDAEVISDLRRLTSDRPLNEHSHALLMLALYRCGRQGEALAVYRAARRILVGELGCGPGPELQHLHQRILNGDPDLAASVPAPAAGPEGPVPVVPRELPGAPGHFTGRMDELRALTGLLERSADGTAGTLVVSAIGGTAGIGKTTLAVQWAHQVADRFPDGQLYVNLRGFHPSGRPVPPAEAVRGFLDALGVPAERIPVSPDAQAGLYRSLLSGKRVLVMLDNARDAEQVRPMLPASRGCLVLVTSRNQLAGLVAAEGAHTLTLDLLPQAEARELLALRLDPERLAAEPGAAADLIELCAGLPLALAIAAARASARPALRLGTLAEELKDAQLRLDGLETGDPAVSARAVFSWSLDDLPAPAVRLFRLLGLHPGPDIAIPAAASLAGIAPPQARGALSELTRAQLLSEHVPGRYAMHDLLHAYAAEQACALESHADQQAATYRMLDHYLHTAWAADRLLRPTRVPIAMDPPQPGTAPEEFSDGAQAFAWFQAEKRVLLGAVELVHAAGLTGYAWKLPWALTVFLDCRGDWQQIAVTQEAALAAARSAGDKLGQANAHADLGRACMRLGRTALGHLEQALYLYHDMRSTIGQGRIHLSLALALDTEGRYDEAFAHNKDALRLLSQTDDQAGQADALSSIGWSYAQRGDYPKALDCCRQAIELQRDVGNRHGEANTLDSIGYVYRNLGQYAEAIGCYEQSVSLFWELSDRYHQADTLVNLGDTLSDAEDPRGARSAWQKALNVLEDLHHPHAVQVRARLLRPPCPQQSQISS